MAYSRRPMLDWSTCELSEAVSRTKSWINEALHLRDAGMPPSAYRLHFEAPMETAEHVWGAIKSLAAFLHIVAQSSFASRELSPWPVRKPDGDGMSVSSVQRILSEDFIVQFPCPMGTLGEFEEEIDRMRDVLRDETIETWWLYGQNLLAGELDTSWLISGLYRRCMWTIRREAVATGAHEGLEGYKTGIL
ncbi:hypothetical protein G6011_03914 [Alternaria panax]|uniref:Uncharacterized protein n=1 Tax=Alternaria panax TaxID=48097 RepID=A0AAD4IG26_9PLEO|nr:hypothetical protein G6011_03914 [Alternaria panax]